VIGIECLIESGIVKPDLPGDLLSESNELVAIFAASERKQRNEKEIGSSEPLIFDPPITR
jgi:hypothetical protein